MSKYLPSSIIKKLYSTRMVLQIYVENSTMLTPIMKFLIVLINLAFLFIMNNMEQSSGKLISHQKSELLLKKLITKTGYPNKIVIDDYLSNIINLSNIITFK